MGHCVIETKRLHKLIAAAQTVQTIVSDGTLAAADREPPHHPAQNRAVAAFDILALSCGLVANDLKDVSPFLRYRREILGESETATTLRALVLCMRKGAPCNLGALLRGADAHHTRVALECVVGYSNHGEQDQHFTALAAECELRAFGMREAA